MNCRLCLNECKQSISLLASNDDNNWYELIFKHLCLKIEPNDVYSTIICRLCSKALTDFHSFFESIQKCQHTLQNLQLLTNAGVQIKTERECSENEEDQSVRVVNEAAKVVKNELHQNLILPDVPVLGKETLPQVKQECTTEEFECVDYEVSFMDIDEGDQSLNETAISETAYNRNIPNEELGIDCHNVFDEIPSVSGDFKNRTCALCSKVAYTSAAGMERHMRIYHGKKQDDIIRRTCPTRSKTQLRSPIGKTHNEIRPFACERCNKRFLSRSDLLSHLEAKNCLERITHMSDSNKFTCCICNMNCKNRASLHNHMRRSHKGEKTNSCKACGLHFVTQDTLQAHLKLQSKCASKMNMEILISPTSTLGKKLLRSNEDNKDLRLQRKYIRLKTDILQLPSNKFESYFRLNKEAFKYVLGAIEPKMKKGIRATFISNTLKLATTLRFLAHGSYQQNVGNDFQLGLAQTTVSVILTETLNVLESVLCPEWIKFPMTKDEEAEAKLVFFKRTQFPGVIGCVDGTYIEILAPNKEEQNMYCNSKGRCSLNAMIVCDHKMRIRFLDAQHGGSVRDSSIWNTSLAKIVLQERFVAGERSSWLLGDSSYPLEPYLITPYRSAQEGSPEDIFNSKHTKAKNVVERTIGALKNKFRCLFGARQLHYKPYKATRIANVCAALHNICIEYEIYSFEDIDHREIYIEEGVEIDYDIENSINREAWKIREQIKSSFL